MKNMNLKYFTQPEILEQIGHIRTSSPTINDGKQYGQDGTGRLTVRVEPQ